MSSNIKIVFHADQVDHWPAALTNVKNVTRDFPAAQVRVVANGAGVYLLLGKSDLTERMRQAAELGVQIQVCRNALNALSIAESDVPPFAQVVPAGVIAIAEAQNEGFSYIKP
jgi:intracellular sulfur oxidation DsrE/DsrF family protein